MGNNNARIKKIGNKKKWIIASLAIVLVSLCAGGGYMLYQQVQQDKLYKELNITFQEITQVEYGDKITSKDLIASSTGTIESYPEINTMKTGKQTLTFLISKSKIKKEITYEIEIKDTKAPIITLKDKQVTLKYEEKYNPQDNIKEVKDPVDGKLDFVDKEENGKFWIKSDLDIYTAGTYEVIVYAKDNHNNESKVSFDVTVQEKEETKIENPEVSEKNPEVSEKGPEEPKEDPQPTNPQEGTQPYYVNGVLLVNKNHGLPYEYGGGADATAYAALQQLQSGAQENGFSMPLISGYRSYDYQASLYNNYVAQDGQAAADRYSARPGYSEHQTGLAFDIGELNSDYGNTPAGNWLAQHAHEYGFIIRYPQGKESITGYMYEPWHVRYLGDLASSVYESGVTLEEYLGVY